MQDFKKRWQITETWQLIFPFLGVIGLLFSGYLLGKAILDGVNVTVDTTSYVIALIAISIFLSLLFLWITLLFFKPLERKWKVAYRWELIAIFIVFAITGSSAARLSDPLLHSIGLTSSNTNPWLFWPIRILIIFPVYQVLLIFIGWIFGQFKFFWNFEKKMLKRMGFTKFIKN